MAAMMLLAGLTGAAANDSMAEIGAGGLVLGRSDVVSIESETLYLSMDEVRVDYRFRNNSDADVETIVAFPMPDIPFSTDGDMAIPVMADNFLGFTVEIDGALVTPALQQRAIVAGGVDITGLLSDAGLPVAPFAGTSEIDISALTAEQRVAIEASGALEIAIDYETGAETGTAWPRWTVRSAYWWTMTFPANREIAVRHTYRPATGGAAGIFFAMEDEGSATYRTYQRRYCMDAPFLSGVERRLAASNLETGPFYTEAWLSYVLTTGANWAGPIRTFRLIVDKGSTDNLVSFCGEGVEKTGPTTFELTYEDFWPERDLDVLFIVAQR